MIDQRLDPTHLCRDFIKILNCVATFPTCDLISETTGRLLSICPSLCPMIDALIAQCSVQFVDNPSFVAINELFDSFICLEATTYYQFPLEYIETDPANCLSLG